MTGGPTPVTVDSVRRLTNKFTGRLGVAITDELFLRGAEVMLVLAGGVTAPSVYLPWRAAHTFDDYVNIINEELENKPVRGAVFSAAVADYRPEAVLPGKTPSGGALETLRLVPTPKVIAGIREQFPELHMVTFKYQEEVSHDELVAVARARLDQGYQAVVANRGEERGPAGEQVAYLVTATEQPSRLVGKAGIARGIADHLERALGRG